MASYEERLRKKFGQPIEEVSNRLGQNLDEIAAQKMAALKAFVQGRPGTPQPRPAQPMNPQAMQGIPEVQPNAPTMSAQDAQSRTNAMIAAPATMDQVSAKLRQQADQDAAHEAAQNALESQDMSGYSDYGKPAPQAFAALKSKIAPAQAAAPTDVRQTLGGGPVEMTPELEKQLGYGSQDEDEEDQKSARGDSGTRGGV